MSPLVIALLFGGCLIVLGLITGAVQWTTLRELRERKHVPSDELRYLKKRAYRRLATAGVLILLGCQVSLSYVTGQEARADALAHATQDPNQQFDENGVPIMSADQKLFFRFWWSYWILAIVLIFLLVGFAAADAIATRRYWIGLYREMRQQHQAILQRDLAVYHQQKAQSRLKPNGPSDPSPSS
ncbi:MAG: hypothetical protein ACRC8S_21730 [Fimbriiglobus sp.]